MKKIFWVLLMLLSFPIFVKAEESVVITKVELENKTDSTEALEEPTFNIRKINFNLKFSEVGDYAEYKVTLKNNSDKDYEIKNENNFLDSEYIKYEFSYGDSNILKAKEEKSIYIKLLYNKKVSEEHFVDGKYILNDSVKLDLVNDYIVVKVPPTHIGYSMFMVILGIFALTTSFILLILTKDKKVKMLSIICLLIIPFTVLALESISLEVDAKIEIRPAYTGTIYRYNSVSAKIGDSIVPVKGTKYAITDGIHTTPFDFETEEECQTILEESDEQGELYCTQLVSNGIGEYTTDASTLNKSYYLKHDVVEDIITASYVCFVYNNEEHCMRGGIDEQNLEASVAFASNTQIIKDFQTFYNLPNNGTLGCTFVNSSSICRGGNFESVEAWTLGHAVVKSIDHEACAVTKEGSDCGFATYSNLMR